jgi:hypothetical protein
MRKSSIGNLAMLAALLVSMPCASAAQDDPPLTPVDFEKLRLRTLDEKKTVQLPPTARRALGLPESRMEFKQLVAGDEKQQYFFIVRVDNPDDVCVSVKNEEATRLYLTNPKLEYRGGAASVKPDPSRRVVGGTPIRAIPSGDPAAAAEFAEILRVWAQVAQSF